MYRYVSFVLRIRLGKENSIVGGRITHVGSQQSAYFRELDKAVRFIKEHLQATVDQPERNNLNSTAVPTEDEAGGTDRC